MIIELDQENCYQVAQFDDTKEWFIEFKSVRQIDQMIEDLKSLKDFILKKKQREYDRKHQLTLKF